MSVQKDHKTPHSRYAQHSLVFTDILLKQYISPEIFSNSVPVGDKVWREILFKKLKQKQNRHNENIYLHVLNSTSVTQTQPSKVSDLFFLLARQNLGLLMQSVHERSSHQLTSGVKTQLW